MRVLIAEDEPVSLLLLTETLASWGYEVAAFADGNSIWEVMRQEKAPSLVILDWEMPGLDGVEICQRARDLGRKVPYYILLLTARHAKADIVGGLACGANDYITKPFDQEELLARLKVGERMLLLETELDTRVNELEAALHQVKQLQGMLPICAYCKKIRADEGYWQEVESYLHEHSEAEFSHGICPQCFEKVIGHPYVSSKPK